MEIKRIPKGKPSIKAGTIITEDKTNGHSILTIN